MSIHHPGDGADWFYVTVGGVAEGALCGILQNQYQREPLKFRGLDQFLRLAQWAMDKPSRCREKKLCCAAV